MSIALADLRLVLDGRFPGKVRARGAEIQAQGLVYIEHVDQQVVLARVEGDEPCLVELPLVPDATVGNVLFNCSCPAFERFGPCPHLWAVVLELAEQFEGQAAAPQSRPAGLERLRALRPVTPGDEPDPWAAVAGREQQLRYVLDVVASASSDSLVLEIRRARRLKDGSWGQARRHDPYRRENEAAALADPLDRHLLAAFCGARESWAISLYSRYRGLTQHPSYLGQPGPGSQLALEGPLARTLIGDLCATGRFFWERADEAGGPLAWDDGAPWLLQAAVERREQESELTAWLARGDERLPLDEPLALFGFGLLLTRTGAARFEHQGSLDLALELRSRGPLRVPENEEGELVAAALNLHGRALQKAPVLPPVEPGSPVPHLLVETGGRRRRKLLGCAIHFDYAGVQVTPEDPRNLIAGKGEARLLRRDRPAEQRAIERFIELGGRRSAQNAWHEEPGSVDVRLFPALVRALLAEGWTVEAEKLRWRMPGETSVSVSSGVDWFDLSGGVQYGDQVAGFPELLAAARAGRDTVILGDGSIGLLPERWLESWNLLAFGEAGDEGVRFRSSQAWLIDALLAERENVETDAGFEHQRKRLAGFEGVQPVFEPPGFQGELRPYQREGLGWLGFLESFGIGGCLADDMGLGKTIQVLAYLEQRRAARRSAGEPTQPTLIVAPRSLVFNWIDEAARFTPELTALDYTGMGRKDLRVALAEHDLVLTTYGTLRRDAAFLAEIEFDCIVLDEAQAIKNATSQTAKAARLLRADRRLALSGTPIENHLGELWSLFEFLNPGMLGRSRTFSDLLARGQDGALDPALLGRALRPFFLRRRKEEVLDDLPLKTEQILHCVLPPKERRRYDELREHFRSSLMAREEEVGLGRMKIQVLEALLRLRQAACHPALLDPDRKGESSAKLDALIPLLAEIVDEGHKALVFSQFTSFLALVRPRLEAAGLTYEYLDGRTRDRKARVERFQNDPDCPLFLISIKAGGQGLNLTAADYIFLLDPWWNPAVESQAIDRAHRIGRTRPVVAYRLIAENTIEERIQELQAKKRALAKALFDGGTGGLRGLTREELERLFAG